MSKTDEELLREFQRGDEAAFATLYNRYRLPLYRFLARKLGNIARAEDITQEVFVAVVQHADEWREEASVKTYLYRIAFNRAVSELRRSEHKVMVAEKDTDPEDGPPPREAVSSDSPAENYELRERARLVREALQKIDPEFRDAILLKEYEDLKYEEIADILGIAVGTVKSRIFRGKLELKKRLEKVMRTEG
ncbi:MAG: RNA polymerase sigma factor [Blastocatellia bacterium]|nr:RNA polymerase sigma factor [Blastocatellia bacterium]